MAGEHILNGVLIYIKWASNIYYFGERIGSAYGYKKKCPTTSRSRAPNFINQYLYLYKNLNSYFDSSSTASSAFLAVRFAAGFLAAGAFVFSSFARSFSSAASIFSILVCRRTISFDFISISSS